MKLHSDGLSTTSDPWVELLRNTLPWEADLVEGPWIIHKDGYYYLFYSGHCYCDGTYATGVARSKNALGPYEKKGDPIRKSDSVWVGPGHCSVLHTKEDPNQYVMVYHAW